jgi:asparagine synthase (glutamine-hydrolysing)
MCGFAGFVTSGSGPGEARERRRVLRAMGAQIRRRGPDDEQLLDDGRLGLVFRRLSIVDCDGGRQPIANEDETVFIAVNGEIYNHRALRQELTGDHRFRTESDCEVVLHLYEELGERALERLVGMFAIAIWDTTRGRLFLARDRLGIKPLYYAPRGEVFLFASELKALLAHPACPREFAWEDLHRLPGRPPTYVRGVESLPGGHFLVLEAGQVRVAQYWSLEPSLCAADEGLPADDYVSRYADLLEDSVRLRLMSDVPVGLFLSGGLDSSVLAGIAAAAGAPLPCFTIVERGSWACGDAQAAADLAAHVGAPFHPVLFDHRTIGADLGLCLETFEYFVWLMEVPTFTLEFLFKHELHRFARAAVPGLKVMLNGQGADEFSGGYSNSAWEPHAGWDDYVRRTVVPERRTLRLGRLRVPDLLAPLLAPDALGAVDAAPFRDDMRYRLHTLQAFNLWHEDGPVRGRASRRASRSWITGSSNCSPASLGASTRSCSGTRRSSAGRRDAGCPRPRATGARSPSSTAPTASRASTSRSRSRAPSCRRSARSTGRAARSSTTP